MEGIHGGDIYTYEPKIDFSANINPLGPPKRVIEAIQKSILLSDHYPDVSCRKLRRSLMEAEQVPVESILCGNGAADLILPDERRDRVPDTERLSGLSDRRCGHDFLMHSEQSDRTDA